MINVPNAIAIQGEPLKVVKMAEFNYLIPRFNIVALQVNKLKQAEMLTWYLIHTTDLIAIIPDQVQLFHVA